MADPLGPPPVGQTDDDQSCIARRVENTLLPGADENGLGHYADDLLDEQGGAGEEPARVTATKVGVGLGSEQAERRPERPGEPGRQFDRGPVVLYSTERSDNLDHHPLGRS